MPLTRVIISGGGTGGHIFPAIAIADRIKASYPDAEILFVGAEGKMEMEKVPKAGYKIVGLPIRGLQRKLTLKNLLVPFKLLASLWKSRRIVREFKPDIAIGVGGYASAAVVRVATKMGVPGLIQEQNSFPGITNKWLAGRVKTICVAYDHLERFFPAEKIVKTGNPVRNAVVQITGKRGQAFAHFNLDPEKKTILVIGGSLGAKTLNESLKLGFEKLLANNFQIIWQCGKLYFTEMRNAVGSRDGIFLSDFIYEMDLAYAAADVIISRAGAISVSELCLVGKPVILVPSPNVSEDHQTKNAMALVNNSAALLVTDSDARNDLVQTVIMLINDNSKMRTLSENIRELGIPDAADRILAEILKITGK